MGGMCLMVSALNHAFSPHPLSLLALSLSNARSPSRPNSSAGPCTCRRPACRRTCRGAVGEKRRGGREVCECAGLKKKNAHPGARDHLTSPPPFFLALFPSRPPPRPRPNTRTSMYSTGQPRAGSPSTPVDATTAPWTLMGGAAATRSAGETVTPAAAASGWSHLAVWAVMPSPRPRALMERRSPLKAWAPTKISREAGEVGCLDLDEAQHRVTFRDRHERRLDQRALARSPSAPEQRRVRGKPRGEPLEIGDIDALLPLDPHQKIK